MSTRETERGYRGCRQLAPLLNLAPMTIAPGPLQSHLLPFCKGESSSAWLPLDD
jgi:hypothetical protein